MAGIAKIASKNLDEVSKINGAVLIGLGDALVAEVRSPKTFYAGSTALKTGTMPLRTLNPANENVPAGYYALTTLSAVDADLAAANIKQGVNIFGFDGTVAPGITFADYHYYEDLSGGASHTPPAQTLSVLFGEVALSSSDIHVEFYDGSGWGNGYTSTQYEKTCNVFQDNDQNLRIANGSGSARRTALTGMTWS